MTRSWQVYLLAFLLLGAGTVAAIHFDLISFPKAPQSHHEAENKNEKTPSSLLSPIAHPSSLPELPPGVRVKFVDVTKESGIHFEHFDGHTEMEYIMETLGSGLGWLDYYQDGLM